ncbi:PSD1 and planctomycete cytochrome C domain-containing protein [Maribacter sp. HTCC2170]|uniref:PSD1 and planctomycete cytochrome C domain-containing protein n=1 Tax=Maribacter sp. (strain HTCC2170 / KCCM 42371) TaxID=313603 RepID=UPI00006BE0B3|nr:PSD1 and planctomycete cytochrome C domain-containing protein [Maribacter sp. HTCC2170]EAQ99997.1 hypothetical protein FB2170_01447 [Maribacter sp. HTCC2170]
MNFSTNNYVKVVLGFVFALLVSSCENNPKTTQGTSAVAQKKIPEKVDFTFHVKPIISDRCFKCHGPDKNAIEGGLSLNTAEDAFIALGKEQDHFAIVPGDVEKSELVNRIYTDDPNLMMPPPESNLELNDYEKKLLTKWIEQGAEFKDHWAYIPPSKQEIPDSPKDKWGNNEIDNFIVHKQQEIGLNHSEKTSKEKLIRRLSFDLTGLPPSEEQIHAFVADDAPEAFEKVIDTFLNTDDYAEHMATEWMDIARYADTHGYQDDFERLMWPWRDWVIHAFNENMPYDKFITYQLAGDLLPNPTEEQILATGFNRNHKITFEGGVIPEEYRVEYVEDRTNTFGTAFLGLTFECARCHDHKYDPISQKEHFELFSFFNNLDEDGFVAGGAGVIPKPFMTITEKEKNGVLQFINFDENDKKEIKLMVMEEMKTPRPAFILNRGVYDQPTDEVYPNTPSSIMPFPKEFPRNRLGLAKWLFHKDNPLTARVTINRLWQRMFGVGLVASAFDFGNQGALPSHPELLDFLALKLIEEQWDIKKMLKYIASSATYQQSSEISEIDLEIDPENRYLARASRLRLSAETIRDQALQISGLLNKEIGGPSVKPYQPEGIWEETTGGGGGTTATYVLSEGNDIYRKSLYTFWKRTVPPPSMMTFDASSRDLCSVTRQQTNTPLQALVLLNDPQLIEASRVLALKELKKGNDLEAQITSIFQKATSRLPDENEKNMLSTYYKQTLESIKNKEIQVEEYLAIGNYKTEENIAKEEWGALALTAHTILNLDETITRG